MAAFYRDLGKEGTVVGGGDKVTLRGMMGTRVPPLGTNIHDLLLTVSREAQGVMVGATLDGASLGAGLDAAVPNGKAPVPVPPAPPLSRFHEIALSTGQAATNALLLTDVRLQANPPEQSLIGGLFRKDTSPAAPGSNDQQAKLWLIVAGVIAALAIIIALTWKLARMQNANRTATDDKGSLNE